MTSKWANSIGISPKRLSHPEDESNVATVPPSLEILRKYLEALKEMNGPEDLIQQVVAAIKALDDQQKTRTP